MATARGYHTPGPSAPVDPSDEGRCSVPRVRETDPSGRHDLPKAAPRGRCRNCGKRFTRKRAAQVFCTPNCRKRAADASTPPKTASDLREQAAEGGHLGKKGKKFPDPDPKT